MKKIDLHIHTVPSFSDSNFVFSLDTFKRYVSTASLDAVAVTNHDLFNGAQFKLIQQSLGITVFPGIEINLEKGHLLIFGSPSELEDFQAKANLVSQKITKKGDTISVDELKAIYGNLGQYLVIPHFDKAPPIDTDTFEKLKPYICAGEVDSAKKFVRLMKDSAKPTPVLFSDSRMKADLEKLPTRHTYVDCGTLTIGALNTCLRDKSKVALSQSDGNELWAVLENGQKISTGLNVLIGARSTGKTYTLNEISAANENVKYIKQFELVQLDEAHSDRDFRSDVEKRRSLFVDSNLSGLKGVIEEVIKLDLIANDRQVERYVETLLKSAAEADRQDAFSKATLFSEEEFPVGNTSTLRSLIESVKQVIENVEFRSIIEKHVELAALKRLVLELIELYRSKTLDINKKKQVNSLVAEIKQGLKVRSSAVQVEDVNLYNVSMDLKRVQRFAEIVEILKKVAVIFEETIQGFRIEARREAYTGAGDIKTASGTKLSFAGAWRKYPQPYEYLRELLELHGLPRSDIYKLFAKISYKILNKDGAEVSGGERSEFRLLQEIKDAQNYDILLIDEPESSFDNIFLNSDVNQILKGIAENMPVVVVTHNSTVGASIGADYLLFAKKETIEGKATYTLYSGYPTDKKLLSVDGKEVDSHEVLMDALEAGVSAYDTRRERYEAIKN